MPGMQGNQDLVARIESAGHTVVVGQDGRIDAVVSNQRPPAAGHPSDADSAMRYDKESGKAYVVVGDCQRCGYKIPVNESGNQHVMYHRD